MVEIPTVEHEYRIVEFTDGWMHIYRDGKVYDVGRASHVTVFLRFLNQHLNEEDARATIVEEPKIDSIGRGGPNCICGYGGSFRWDCEVHGEMVMG